MKKAEFFITQIACVSVCIGIFTCTLGRAFDFSDDSSSRFEVHDNNDDDDSQSILQEEDEEFFPFILFYDFTQRKSKKR
jgi:hypothetical protein